MPNDRDTAGAAAGPGALGVGLGALVTAIACLLPWYRVDLGELVAAMPADAQFSQLRDSMGQMMQSMTGGGSLTVRGTDGWVGKLALAGAVVVGVATLLEASGTAAFERSKLLVCVFLAAVLSAVLSIVALTDLGGPVQLHVGLVLALLASATTAVLAFGRLQQPGRSQRTAAAD